jgi:hypothetical protein
MTSNLEGSGQSALDPSASDPSSQVQVARAQVHLAIVHGAAVLAALVGTGVLALMCVPLAHAIAGKHTDFSLTVSLSANVALGAATAIFGGGLIIQTRRVRHHRRRARRLEQKYQSADLPDSGSSARPPSKKKPKR